MIVEFLRSLRDIASVFLIGYGEILVTIFGFLVLFYFIALNSTYLFTTLLSYRTLRRYTRRLKSVDFDELITQTNIPAITLLAPAYNEESTCVESIKSLMSLRYPDYDIIVINDGSKDKTLETLIEAFELEPGAMAPTAKVATAKVRQKYKSHRYPNLWVIDKENGGKADALNVGINYCRTSLFCAMDADTLLEKEALSRIVRPFLEDERTVAAGGIIRIANGCQVESGSLSNIRLPRNYLAQFQVMEYLRAFLSGRMGWESMNASLIISGAFGVFLRSTVVEVGGYAHDTVGEDMELVVKLHKYCRANHIPYRITFVPDPVAWTECPESMKVLGRQRDRWQRGLYEVLTRHVDMLFNPKYGRIGMLAFPYFFFLEMLGPVIELPGYIMFFIYLLLGKLGVFYPVAFFLLALVFGMILSVATVGLEELTFRRYPRTRDLLQLFLLAVIENFGYRQLTTYWRIRGLFSALRGKKTWGKMERKGFTKKPADK